MNALIEELSKPEYASLPDWKVAEMLNEPSTQFPEVTTVESKHIGLSQILAALGPEQGALFLDTIEQLGETSGSIKWALVTLKSGGTLDIASDVLRSQLDNFVQSQILTREQANTLKSLAEKKRLQSWAEYNKLEVTARTVGLARGGV